MSAAPTTSTEFDVGVRTMPLRVWSSDQLCFLQELLERTLCDWQLAWAIASTLGTEATTEADPPNTVVVDGHALWQLEHAAVAAQDAAPPDRVDALRILAVEMFGSHLDAPVPVGAEPVIALEVVQAAWDDWLRRLESALSAPLAPYGDAVDSFASSAWSGTLRAHIGWCGLRFSLVLPGAILSKLLPAKPVRSQAVIQNGSLASLDDALHRHEIRVQVRMNDVTFTLGQLENLQTGDLVLLSHLIDAPLRLVDQRGGALCAAWLGQRSGNIAVELSRLDTPASFSPIPVTP